MKNLLRLLLLLVCIAGTASSQIPELWGAMSLGGSFGLGGIIKIKGDGSGYVMDYGCTGGTSGGSIQSNLLPQSPTLLYGSSTSGGTQAKGDIFSYNPYTKNYTMLYSMDTLSGYYPRGPLCRAANGKLYGMTNNGGIYNKGVFFEFNPVNNQYTKIHDFDITTGQLPNGGVIEAAANNKIYGMTTSGGLNSSGVIFSYDYTSNTFAVVYDLTFSNGFAGFGTLNQAGNGLLYGMAFGGGSLGYGVIFSLNPTTNNYTVLYNFNGADGAAPMGQMVEDGGTLYGCTSQGGTNNKGVIFSYSISGNTFTKLHDFDVTMGSSPYGGVMRASDGKLYGMTLNGGVNNLGAIYSYNLSTNVYTKIYDGSFASGGIPYADLIEYSGPTALAEPVSQEPTLLLSPNPSKGDITIRHSGFVNDFVVQIVDVLGKKVCELPVTTATTNLTLNVKPGIYFYFSSEDANRRCGKLIIE